MREAARICDSETRRTGEASKRAGKETRKDGGWRGGVVVVVRLGAQGREEGQSGEEKKAPRVTRSPADFAK